MKRSERRCRSGWDNSQEDFCALVKRWGKCISVGGGYGEKFFFFFRLQCHTFYVFISICDIFTVSPSYDLIEDWFKVVTKGHCIALIPCTRTTVQCRVGRWSWIVDFDGSGCILFCEDMIVLDSHQCTPCPNSKMTVRVGFNKYTLCAWLRIKHISLLGESLFYFVFSK
jgi:hypothetical protein